MDAAKRLKSQCVAFDFIYQNDEPLILEISYGFLAKVYDKYTVYWDKYLNWHKGAFSPYRWMVEGVINIDK